MSVRVWRFKSSPGHSQFGIPYIPRSTCVGVELREWLCTVQLGGSQ